MGTGIVCSTCGETSSAISDPARGETVCGTCGVVLRDRIEISNRNQLAHSSKDAANDSRGSMPSSLKRYDNGLSTIIPYSSVDARGLTIGREQKNKVKRLRRLDRFSTYNSGHRRNLRTALDILSTTADKLSLSGAVAEDAAYYYRKALAGNIVKGRSIKEMVVASVYAACRTHSVPRTLKDISEAANSDLKFTSKCYRLLVQEVGLDLPEADPNTHLRRISNRAKISEKTFRRAVGIMNLVRKHHVAQGKNPNALAASVLLAACANQDEEINRGKLADAADVSAVTLRKRLDDVTRVFHG